MKTQIGSKQRTPKNHCLTCNQLLDGASCVGDEARPSAGDMMVCIYCGHIMAFDEQQRFRELNAEEAYAVAGDERILFIQKARKHAKPQED